MKSSLICLVLILLMTHPVLAQPDLDLSTCSRAYAGPETAVLYNLPDGSGSAFTEAIAGGSQVDATITLTLVNSFGDPIVNYPAEDLWLESVGGGLNYCPGGTNADVNTDEFGQTFWASALNAGSFSQGLTQVYVAGAPLQSSPGLDISFNSADITGDLVVNLLDLVLFAQDVGGTSFRSDFYHDGVVNLSDIVRVTAAIGNSCP